MTTSPDAIRADIEQTRRELGGDVDALADKVTPSKIVERQTDKIKGGFRSLRYRVMGAAEDAGEGIGDVKDRVVAKAEGNPIAVGLIAFGAGLLAASLIPASQREKEMAEGVKEQAQPLVDNLKDAAGEAGRNLKEPAQNAATAVKDAATDAADTVTQEAKDATQEVKDRTQNPAPNTQQI
jgi:ElaB/YqjD/DUF883 family membrane-anchored ribosome-binding protein